MQRLFRIHFVSRRSPYAQPGGGGAPLPEQLRAVPQFRAEHGLPSDRRTSNEKGRLKVKVCLSKAN